MKKIIVISSAIALAIVIGTLVCSKKVPILPKRRHKKVISEEV